MPKRMHREDDEQKALIQWADLMRIQPRQKIGAIELTADPVRIGDYLFAIPNGGARGRIEAARFKGLGVRPGVSDLMFAFPSQGYHGLFIEMKAPKPYASPVSKPQRAFQDRQLAVGYCVRVCRGHDEARRAIQEYLA